MSQNTIPDIQSLVQLIEETVSQESTDSTRIMSYLKECRQFGIEILPLDVNKSEASCSIEDGRNIRVGFSLLVSGKEPFIEDILTERQQNGGFRSFQDFCERIDLDNITEDFITRCIQVGAFDSIEASRAQLFMGQEKIIQAVRKANAEKSAGQISLFTAIEPSKKGQTIPIEPPDAEEWTEEEMFAHEKKAVGFSLTEFLFLSEDENSPEPEFSELGHEDEIGKSESGDQNVTSEFIEEAKEIGTPSDEEPPLPPLEFSADEIDSSFPQEIVESENTTAVTVSEEDSAGEGTETALSTFVIQLSTTNTTEPTLLQLREIVEKYPGNSRVMLQFISDNNKKTHIRVHSDYSVKISKELEKEIEAVSGEKITHMQE